MNYQQPFYQPQAFHYPDPRNPYAQPVHVHPGLFFHPGYPIPHQQQYYYNQQPWQQNPNAWTPPGLPQGLPQVHPLPPGAPVPSINEPEPESPSLKIDKFWAGRLAPVAGQAESRRLLSSVPVSLKHPDQKNPAPINTNSVRPNIQPTGKLLPPRSLDSQSATSGSQGSPVINGNISIESSDVDKEDVRLILMHGSPLLETYSSPQSIHNRNGFEFDIYVRIQAFFYSKEL